jgi:hypothetical protein
MNKSLNIHIAGHRGLVGSALLRNLKTHSYINLLTRTLNGGCFEKPFGVACRNKFALARWSITTLGFGAFSS